MAASYSACVVYTKTIIHLSVAGESGGYLPSREAIPLRWIIVKYYIFTYLGIHNWTDNG